MFRKTRRAGAFATAAFLFAFLLAADGSGAKAQSEAALPAGFAITAETAEPASADPALAASTEAASTSTIRFVASPVIQAVPEGPLHGAGSTDDIPSLQALVAGTSAEGELGPELTCLAQAVYFESRGEPLTGQLAVARVIINRTASPLFPDDYCSVVTQRAQFSFVHGGQIPPANTRSDAWSQAVRVARIAHQDLWPSAVAEALYFHANRVHPRWAGRKIALARIDSHIFYR